MNVAGRVKSYPCLSLGSWVWRWVFGCCLQLLVPLTTLRSTTLPGLGRCRTAFPSRPFRHLRRPKTDTYGSERRVACCVSMAVGSFYLIVRTLLLLPITTSLA